jgi:ribonuclease Z
VALARGCDILIHMNHYFSGTEPSPAYRAACGNHRDNAVIAKRAGAKTLVLTHLLAQIDQPGIREQIVHEIQQVFDGQVIWGEDLMRLGLSRRIATPTSLMRMSVKSIPRYGPISRAQCVMP